MWGLLVKSVRLGSPLLGHTRLHRLGSGQGDRGPQANRCGASSVAGEGGGQRGQEGRLAAADAFYCSVLRGLSCGSRVLRSPGTGQCHSPERCQRSGSSGGADWLRERRLAVSAPPEQGGQCSSRACLLLAAPFSVGLSLLPPHVNLSGLKPVLLSPDIS